MFDYFVSKNRMERMNLEFLISHLSFSFFFLVTEIVSHQKNSILGQFIQKCSAWSKMSCISALFEMAKVKKSNFQATLPHCTPVLLRKTAPCPPMNQPERDLEL